MALQAFDQSTNHARHCTRCSGEKFICSFFLIFFCFFLLFLFLFGEGLRCMFYSFLSVGFPTFHIPKQTYLGLKISGSRSSSRKIPSFITMPTCMATITCLRVASEWNSSLRRHTETLSSWCKRANC